MPSSMQKCKSMSVLCVWVEYCLISWRLLAEEQNKKKTIKIWLESNL